VVNALVVRVDRDRGNDGVLADAVDEVNSSCEDVRQ
jgi:hypothetical protein